MKKILFGLVVFLAGLYIGYSYGMTIGAEEAQKAFEFGYSLGEASSKRP